MRICCKSCDKCVIDEEEETDYCMVKSEYLSNLEGTCEHWSISIMYEIGYFVAVIVGILGIAGLIMLILGTVNYYKNLGG